MSVLFLHIFLFSFMSFGHLRCSDISMDEKYDIIVLGTGLTESVLSGMMSVSGKKVLHVNRLEYYGGESASLTPLSEVFKHFNMDKEDVGDKYGPSRDWNVDLIPKFIMASGKLVSLLIYTGVTRYLEFKSIEGSYVYKGEDRTIHKIPANETEVPATSWMGQFEKTRFRNLLMFIQRFNINDTSTYDDFMEDINKAEKTMTKHLSPEQVTTKQMFDKFGVDENTRDVLGHAIALYRSEINKESPMLETISRVKLYYDSLSRFPNAKSPYVYPLYGLGELPKGFARLSAIYGGTYILDKEVDDIMYDDGGKVIGVKLNGEEVKTDMVICDPSYAPDKVKKVGQVVRAICILNLQLPQLPSDAQSCQIIIPQNQVNRKHDIFVSVVSHAHNVASKKFYLATVSTEVETSNPELELLPGLDLLGPILQKFVSISNLYEPIEDLQNSNVFISKSYDATSHFETTSDDILDLYKKSTGESFDFSQVRHSQQEDG